jgi:hypothetical protein
VLTVALLTFTTDLETNTTAMWAAFSVPSLVLVVMFWRWGWFR